MNPKTYRDARRLLRERLPAHEAGWILEHAAGIPGGQLPAMYAEPVPPAVWMAAADIAERRTAGTPLQYLLGAWGFMGLTLTVGEGVLIPRQDTETLCEAVLDWIAGSENPSGLTMLDLCAGSGAVGLGVAAHAPGLRVTAVEKSEDALVYLRRNTAAYPALAVLPVQADIFDGPSDRAEVYDIIAANPPYIPTGELSGLMPEVCAEPAMALDGGSDGLRFYRCIAGQWLSSLCPGGLCAVEVGAGQAPAVAEMLRESGLLAVTTLPDLCGVARVVTGIRA